jgi:hypothetical protein
VRNALNPTLPFCDKFEGNRASRVWDSRLPQDMANSTKVVAFVIQITAYALKLAQYAAAQSRI